MLLSAADIFGRVCAVIIKLKVLNKTIEVILLRDFEHDIFDLLPCNT